jgi:hypothetical protein
MPKTYYVVALEKDRQWVYDWESQTFVPDKKFAKPYTRYTSAANGVDRVQRDHPQKKLRLLTGSQIQTT